VKTVGSQRPAGRINWELGLAMGVSKNLPICLVPGQNLCCAKGAGQSEPGVARYSPETTPGRGGPDQRKNRIGLGTGLVLDVLHRDRLNADRKEKPTIIENARL
jgi:hypothetical protein